MVNETEGLAEGNARARLYSLASQPPFRAPFKTYLTREEEDRHFFFNDDILLIAEHIDRLHRNIQPPPDLTPERRQQYEFEMERAIELDNLGLYQQAEQNLYGNSSLVLDGIAANEAAILRELEEVRTEYRMYAEALNDEREQYVRVRAIVSDFEEQADRTEADFRAGAAERGIDLPDDVSGMLPVNRYMPTLDVMEAGIFMREYEETYSNYKLLEEGFAVTTAQESFDNFVWGAAGFIITELVTFGVFKYVRVARASLEVAEEVLATVAGAVVNVSLKLIARFNALLPRTRNLMVRLQRSREVSTRTRAPEDGLTNQRVVAQADEAAQVCRVC